ncbi:MAG: alpha/beta fold hydrolase [Balneolaceae bacterium]|nr:alpha/beta fold hydrolase [Balneolaceae bacterium]
MKSGILNFITIVAFMAMINLHSTAQELIIPNGDLEIGGTLELPESHQKGDLLVIMITGSGAQDRDETILGFKPFKLIAEHLMEEGIASFRYDDRQMGTSTGDFSSATLDDLANDVKAIMDYFQFQSETVFDEFILFGHSQGGIVSTRLAANDDRITAMVLMASTMVPLKDVINEQVIIMQKAAGKTEDDIQPILEFQELAYETARKNEGWDELKVEYQKLIENEVAKLPENQRQYIVDVESFANAQFSAQVTPLQSAQMRSLLYYDPVDDLDGLEIPILALFGGKDTQVTPVQNETVFVEVCENDRMNCSNVNFPNANHLFQRANTGFVTEYAMLPKEFVDGFLEEISEWILGME